jgi:hypothetical protein
MTMGAERGLVKEVWLLVRDGEILDCVMSDEAAINFLANEGDEVIPYTIRI